MVCSLAFGVPDQDIKGIYGVGVSVTPQSLSGRTPPPPSELSLPWMNPNRAHHHQAPYLMQYG